jgi:hypothetical protein
MDRVRTIKCCKCGHIWEENLDELDERDLLTYRGDDPRVKVYRVPCRKCHTVNVIEVEEGGDG